MGEDVAVSVVRIVAHTVALTVRAVRVALSGTLATGRFVGRRLHRVRSRGGAGEAGMMRLLDLHATSVAGDTLVALGLAGTVFFAAPVGEARDRVALYLLVTMAPFVLIAPVVGPVLDRFRHGRRYALAVTMLGRAFLAWVIAGNLDGDSVALYPAAFGMLVLSRAYGVARAAAVPRLLPERLSLVEAGARASLFGILAGALVVPAGFALGYFGPEWIMRGAALLFVVGMVSALRLPPRADSDPPETVPALFRLPGRRGKRRKVLSGRLVVAALTGSAALRALYGCLTLFLAFRVKEGDFDAALATLPKGAALAVIAGALGAGSFVATAVLTRMRIHRPLVLQAIALTAVTGLALLATASYGLWAAALLCVVAALASGMAKLAVDAVIQERLPERARASAFAHSETFLMLAWVAGGALGLLPVAGSVGLGIAAACLAVAAVRLAVWAAQLRQERLTGTATEPTAPTGTPDAVRDDSTLSFATTPDDDPHSHDPHSDDPTTPLRDEPTMPLRNEPTAAAQREPQPTGTTVTEPAVPPGFHLYRPGRSRRDPNP